MEPTEYDYSRNAPEPLLTKGMRFVFYTVPQPVLETFNNVPQFFINMESKEKGDDKKDDIRVYVRFEPVDIEDPDARKAMAADLTAELIAHLKKHLRKYRLRDNSDVISQLEFSIATLLDAVDQTDVWVQSKRKAVRGFTMLQGQIGLDCLTELTFNFTSEESCMQDPTLPIHNERVQQNWDNIAAAGYATLFGVPVIYWVTRPFSHRADFDSDVYRKFVTTDVVTNAVNEAIRQSFDKYNRKDLDARTYIEDVTLLDITIL